MTTMPQPNPELEAAARRLMDETGMSEESARQLAAIELGLSSGDMFVTTPEGDRPSVERGLDEEDLEPASPEMSIPSTAPNSPPAASDPRKAWVWDAVDQTDKADFVIYLDGNFNPVPPEKATLVKIRRADGTVLFARPNQDGSVA